MTYTPAWAIEKYLAIREEEREDKRAFDERSTERKGKMDLLENYLLGTMNEQGLDQFKTSAGTAYKSPQMRVTMTDRQAVIEMVLTRVEANDPNAFDIFTNHINKEEVKRLLDNGVPPSGIEVNQFVQCNVRRA